ncbi:hypothetical protein AB3N59_19450 [Leptospira sp. WS92.C1]
MKYVYKNRISNVLSPVSVCAEGEFEFRGKRFLFFFLLILVLGACRHAWVRFPQTPPLACQIYTQSSECKRAIEDRIGKQGQTGKIHNIHQKYYFFGLMPARYVVDISKYCPEGPKSAHQFTSFWDAVWEQLTFTIYSPQTLEVECYP